MPVFDPSDLDLSVPPTAEASRLCTRILGLVTLLQSGSLDRDDPDFARIRAQGARLQGLDLGTRPDLFIDATGLVAQRDNNDRWALLSGPWAEEVLRTLLARVEQRALRFERRRLKAIADAQEVEQARLSLEARLAAL